MAEVFKEPEPEPVAEFQEPEYYEPVQTESDIAHKAALETLIGGNRHKRARMEDINIIDINSSDIIPSKEEYERSVLKNQTGFVPTGNLTGDWSCTSKRKSHITYLADKAKANEQELEAMWSLNRQTKRQTQSKYGF
jgi:proline-rich protein PRCC